MIRRISKYENNITDSDSEVIASIKGCYPCR